MMIVLQVFRFCIISTFVGTARIAHEPFALLRSLFRSRHGFLDRFSSSADSERSFFARLTDMSPVRHQTLDCLTIVAGSRCRSSHGVVSIITAG